MTESTSMRYTRLGDRGPQVSRIAFGNWSAGGDWGAVDRGAAIAATRAALDLGITVFDTARAYGFGAAEGLLGEALRPELRSARRSVIIATKGGLRQEGGRIVRDSSPASLRHDLESSLRALGTDYVDLYQVHWPDPATSIAETAETMDRFVREGKVRFVGVSNFDAGQMTEFQRVRPIDTLQPPYHVFRRDIEKTILPFAQEHGVGVLVYGPLAHGLLTGRMTEATRFASGDWRATSDLFVGDAFTRNLRIVRALEAFAAARDASVAQLAVAWTLANPAVDVAIVGARSPRQIAETVRAVELKLSAGDLAEIRQILRDEVPVGGPAPEAMPKSHPGPGSRPRVAILGTGKMGSAIAGRLAEAGFELTLWNRTRSRAEALGVGAIASSPAAAARAADVVISSVTGQEALRAMYLGPDGVSGAAAGKLFIEMSTAGPDVVPVLSTAVTAAGGRFVNAPILGAPPIVRSGGAMVLLGGSDHDIADATTVLSAIGLVRPVSSPAAAARLKLIANSMLADVVLAAAELQVAGEEAGLDADDVFSVLERVAPALEPRRRGYTQDRHDPVLFALRDLRKDLGLALALFRTSGAVTPLTVVTERLVAGEAAVSENLDITAVIRPYRRASSAQADSRIEVAAMGTR